MAVFSWTDEVSLVLEVAAPRWEVLVVRALDPHTRPAVLGGPRSEAESHSEASAWEVRKSRGVVGGRSAGERPNFGDWMEEA